MDQRHNQPDSRVGCTPDHRGISLGWGSALYDPRPGSHLWHHRHTPIVRHGHPGQANCTSLTLAEWLFRTADRIDPARVLGPRYCFGRGTSAPDSKIIRRLLQLRQNASVFATAHPSPKINASLSRCDISCTTAVHDGGGRICRTADRPRSWAGCTTNMFGFDLRQAQVLPMGQGAVLLKLSLIHISEPTRLGMISYA